MPSFSVRTRINAPMQDVWTQFDAALLSKLSPPFPKVRIVRFDGCQTGDLVSLELNLLVAKLIWTSQITDSIQNEAFCAFVDEGVKMPFGLQFWQHKHRVKKITEESCEIIDEISFDTRNAFLNYLLFPFLWGMIFYRKPFYKKYLSLINPL